MISRLSHKVVAAILTGSILVSSVAFLAPQKAEADTANCAAVVAGAVASAIGISSASKTYAVPSSDSGTQATTVVGAGSSYGTFFKDCVLTPLAIRLAKAMLQNITSSLIDWINNGFHGSPSFVQDFKGLLTDTVDQTVGDFLSKDLGAGFLCSSFSLQVKISIAKSYLPYSQRAACTLTQIENNVNGFIQGDNTGSWDNWLQTTTQPQNNVFGATIYGQDALSQKIFSKLDIQNRQLDWGKGFRSWTVCTDPGSKPDDPNCKNPETRTPGSVVESQLENNLGSGVRQLEVANDIDAIMGALTNQLMSQVISGAKGLLGAGKKSDGSYQSTSYTQALAGGTTDSDLASAVNSGVTNLSSEAVIPTTNSQTTGTTGTTGTPSTNTQTPATATLTLTSANGGTSILASGGSFSYEVDLATDVATSSLKIETSIKKDGVLVPFFNVLYPLQFAYGQADGQMTVISLDYSSGYANAPHDFSGIFVRPNIPFRLVYMGQRRPDSRGLAVPTGVYSIDTEVQYPNGKTITQTTTKFIVR